MMWGTTSPSAKLTGDSGSAFEALLIGDCRLFRSLAENQLLRLLGLLQHYRRKAAVHAQHDEHELEMATDKQMRQTLSSRICSRPV